MGRMKTILLAWGVCAALLVAAPGSEARTKLAALPERGEVTIRLDNPDATLVEEIRVLTLQQGENHVDFAWRGVQVDPDSIRLTILSAPAEVTLLSVSYPPGEGALVWRIHAAEAGEARAKISYLLSGIDRLVDYRATASKDERTLELTGLLIMRNFSGEDFAEATVTLAEGQALTGPTAHEQTRQSVLFRSEGVRIKKTFTWDAAVQPWEPKRVETDVGIPVRYELENVAADGLGERPLWGGKARVYQEDGHGGTIFLGEDRTGFTPVGETMKIRIGESRDVAVTQLRKGRRELNHRPDVKRVQLLDIEERYEVTVENFKTLPVTVDLVEHAGGQWELAEAGAAWERKDAATFVFPVELGPKEKKTFGYVTLTRNVRR